MQSAHCDLFPLKTAGGQTALSAPWQPDHILLSQEDHERTPADTDPFVCPELLSRLDPGLGTQKWINPSPRFQGVHRLEKETNPRSQQNDDKWLTEGRTHQVPPLWDQEADLLGFSEEPCLG